MVNDTNELTKWDVVRPPRLMWISAVSKAARVPETTDPPGILLANLNTVVNENCMRQAKPAITQAAPRSDANAWKLRMGLKCYKDVDCPTVRSQAGGIVDVLSAALHDVTGRLAITEA